TATEIYDYLRLLFARVGRTFCLQCGQEVKKDTVDEVTDAVLALGEAIRLNVLFPLQAGGPTSPTQEPARSKKRTKERSAGVTRASRPRRPGAALSDELKTRLSGLRQRGFNR